VEYSGFRRVIFTGGTPVRQLFRELAHVKSPVARSWLPIQIRPMLPIRSVLPVHRLLPALLLVAGGLNAQTPAGRTPAQNPTLVVLVTIDGFREGNLERFGPQLNGGLGRLMSGGAWFTNAHQDHAITETAPGHASLLSGRFPRSTGISANRAGVFDSESPLVGFSGGPGASPRRFQGTTLVDWIHTKDPRSRALSVSAKDRGAILPVGKSKQQVYWYAPDGEYTTSHYYRDSLPDWVKKFNARRIPATYLGKSWTPLLPDSAYKEPDSVAIEGNGRDFVFPHPMPADEGTLDVLFWTTPFGDEMLASFALEGVQAMGLGNGPQTDVLAVSFSANDAINHRLGPDSKEAHDEVLRLDRTIGIFLDSLFKLRDPSRVALVLTADHGFGTIPELATGLTPPPTRVNLASALAAVHDRMRTMHLDTAAFDVDQQVVLIDRAAFQKAKVNPDSLLDLYAREAKKVPGVYRVDRFRDLLKADTVADPIARRWVHQFPADFPIELVTTLTKGSLWQSPLVASHGTPYDYDSNVPIIFFGPGFNAGRYADFVRTVDIAPTLAALVGAPPTEKLDGVPLRRALK
jgi:predicted AlkP superfamily pyrophosphatase or phosphodiesterase